MPPPRLPTNPIQILKTHTAPINAVTFSHLGGSYILTGSSDRQIHLSRTEPSSSTSTPTSTTPILTSSPIQKYTSHGYAILSLTVSSQNTHFASSGGDRAIFYWDIQTPNTTSRRFGTSTTQAHTSRVTSVAFAGDDDSVLVSGSDDRTVRLWDVKSRDTRPLQVWEEAKDGISALCVSGIEVVAGSIDGRVRAYDLRMGRVVTDVQPGAVTSLEVSRDGKGMLVGCLDGKIRFMDRDNGMCLRMFPGEEEQRGGYKNDSLRIQSCFGMNEGLVLSGSESDGNVKAWDVVSGKLVSDLNVSDSNKVISVVRWREGSKAQGRRDIWAAGGADGMVRIYGA